MLIKQNHTKKARADMTFRPKCYSLLNLLNIFSWIRFSETTDNTYAERNKLLSATTANRVTRRACILTECPMKWYTASCFMPPSFRDRVCLRIHGSVCNDSYDRLRESVPLVYSSSAHDNDRQDGQTHGGENDVPRRVDALLRHRKYLISRGSEHG